MDSSFDVEQEEALLEAKISSELYNTHTHIYDQLEGLARQQISDLHALNVPLMHPSHEETEIATQRKLLDIILEMAGG